jgi:leucyl-tRNA synthetase
MITGKNGIKMSKSKGNVISPDDLVENYGCDSLRMYELFVGPPELDAEWDDRGIDGVYRFLNRFYNLVMENKDKTDFKPSREMVRVHNKMIATISQRFESFSLNTVVSGFMEYTNTLVRLNQAEGGIDHATLEDAVQMLAPFAPHIGEELWRELGHDDSVFHQAWPTFDEEAMKEDEIEYPVQMMGKTRAVIKLPAEVSKEEALAKAKEALGSKLEGKTIIKEIFVPKKIINIVAK